MMVYNENIMIFQQFTQYLVTVVTFPLKNMYNYIIQIQFICNFNYIDIIIYKQEKYNNRRLLS